MTRYGHWNSEKIVKSYSYELMRFVAFSTGLQKLGQRASGGWLNGHFPNVFKGKSVVSTGYFPSGNSATNCHSEECSDEESLCYAVCQRFFASLRMTNSGFPDEDYLRGKLRELNIIS